MYPNGGTRQGRSPRKGLAPASPWAGPASQLTFINRAWAGPALPNPSLLSTGPGPARPPKPSLLSTGPGPARPPTPHFYWPTPHFYWPDPSLLLAKPGRANPENCEPPEPPVQLLCVKWQTLIAHCHIEIVKLPFWFLAEWPRPCAKVAEGRPTNIDRRCSTVSSKATERTCSRVYVITCCCLTTK